MARKNFVCQIRAVNNTTVVGFTDLQIIFAFKLTAYGQIHLQESNLACFVLQSRDHYAILVLHNVARRMSTAIFFLLVSR